MSKRPKPSRNTKKKMRNKDADSLYIHIPFCTKLCGYCDFPKLLGSEKWGEAYITALFLEIDSYNIGKMSTVYIGGGTPTSLNDDLFEKLIRKSKEHLKDGGEFTIEANPDSLSEKKIRIMAEYSVNRVSLGVQSSHEYRLREMGRSHSFEEARNAVELLRKNGIFNINIDLIYGLKGETLEELKEDLSAFIELDTPHISTYCLSVSPGTLFYNKKYNEPGEEESADQYELILSTLRGVGYRRYEVSNFAKDGCFSKHNLTYWKDNRYYGVGLGASGYLKDTRYDNTRNLDKYLRGQYIEKKEEIDPKSEYEYYLLTNLRLEEGIDLEEFEKEFSYTLLNKKEIKEMIESNLLKIENNRLSATDKGMMILDRILLNLF